MASIRNHTSTDVTKLLLVGDSGSGKTATLATLANAGYNLRILDFDDGLAILPEFLLDSAVDRVSFVTLKDPIGKADAFRKSANLIGNWKDGDEDFGPVNKWTSKDVLVIDSLTLMGEAALRGHYRLTTRSLPTKLLNQSGEPPLVMCKTLFNI